MSLSGYFTICVILELIPIAWVFFSVQIEIFKFIHVLTDFEFYSGHFDCYDTLGRFYTSCRKHWDFRFSRQSTHLISGFKFDPAICDLWFLCQFSFRSLFSVNLNLSHLFATQWPVWEFGSALFSSSVLSACLCCLGSDPCLCSLGWDEKFINNLKESLPWTPPSLPSMQCCVFGSLARKLGSLITVICCAVSMIVPLPGDKQWDDKEDKNRG